MQAYHFDASGGLDQFFQNWPCRFDQLRSNLLQQIASLLGRVRLNEMLFCSCQNASQTYNKQIPYEMRSDLLRAAAHIIQLEAIDPLADGGFDFTQCIHARYLTIFVGWEQQRWSLRRRSESVSPGRGASV